jgi:hypothetical protein
LIFSWIWWLSRQIFCSTCQVNSWMLLNVVVEWLTLLLCVQEVLGLNLSLESGCPGSIITLMMEAICISEMLVYFKNIWCCLHPDQGFLWFSLLSLGKCRDSTLNKVTIASFLILSNSSFIYHPVICRYIVCVSEKCH